MMRLKVAMKMMSLVVISGAIAEAVINVPKPGPDCYKKVEKDCVDEARRAICGGRRVPYYNVLSSGCATEIGQTISDPCFFEVLAQDAGKSCGILNDYLLDLSIDIWRYCQDGSRQGGKKLMFQH